MTYVIYAKVLPHGDAQKEKRNMKIAVTSENRQVFQHFGHTEQFEIYTVQNGGITDRTLVHTDGSGHGALAGFLTAHGVDTLICGGIGDGARQALAGAGIRLFGGVTGGTEDAVRALLSGSLRYDENVRCGHHEHHGPCGEHGCGEHGCGE